MNKQDIIKKIIRQDPERFKKTEDDQARLRELFGMKKHMDVKCPYCNAKVETLYQGVHSGSSKKCQHCSMIFYIPPLVFSRLKTDKT